MTIALTINGVTFNYPETNDTEWGYEATNWANAVTNGMLQKAGGTFILQSDVDFGGNFGLLSKYYKSRSANIADSGIVRLAHTDTICWRNLLNNGNICLVPNSGSDILTFNGIDLVDVSTPQVVANKTLVNATLTFPSNPYSAVTTDLTGAFEFETGAVDKVLQATATNPQFNRFLQSNVYTGNVQPVTGVQGDYWFDTTSNTVYTYNGSTWEQIRSDINNIDGVNITSPEEGQFFVYDGTDWVNTVQSYHREATIQTTDATPTVALSIPLQAGRAMTFNVQLSGYDTSDGDTMIMHLKGGLKRFGGITSFVTGSYQEEVFEDAGASTWDAVIIADDPNDELDIQVTGQAATTIRWTMRIDYTVYT